MLSKSNAVFEAIMADGYNDYGTLQEWKEVQKKFRTYFIDVDGVIMKNSGKYGKTNWSNNTVFLEDNVAAIKKLQDDGAQIVITTSRTEEYRKALETLLSSVGIKPYAILTGMNHAARVVINDFAPTNPYPSGIAITLPRNSSIKDYLLRKKYFRSKNMNKQKVALISGITGQDGRYLAKFLLGKGYKVVGLYRRGATDTFSRLKEHGIFEQIELADFDLLEFSNICRLLRKYQPDEFYNLAAQSFVGASWEEPIYTAQADGMGVLYILEAIREFLRIPDCIRHQLLKCLVKFRKYRKKKQRRFIRVLHTVLPN